MGNGGDIKGNAATGNNDTAQRKGTAKISASAVMQARSKASSISLSSDSRPARGAHENANHPTSAPAKPRSRFKDLIARAGSGIIYVAVSIAAAFAGDPVFAGYLALLSGICAYELCSMMQNSGKDRFGKMEISPLAVIGSALYPVIAYLFGVMGLALYTPCLLIATIIWCAIIPFLRVRNFPKVWAAATYTGLLPCALLLIKQSVAGVQGSLLVIGVLASVWLNDALAYLVGTRFGRHKIAPAVSPKKSWEGFAAGMVASCAVWALMSFIPFVFMPIWMTPVLGAIVGIAAFAGDLLESKIKRACRVKDSGDLLPGHGGLLDRCDSVIIAAPVAYALLVTFGCVSNALLV